MIKSKTKTFGFWLCVSFIAFIVFQTVYLFSKPSSNQEKISILLFCLIITPLFGSKLWKDSKTISINIIEKTISFKNIFTRKTKTYNFSELDGYFEVFQPSRGKSYRVLYISKNGIFVEIISSFTYSNLIEIEKGLNQLKFLGHKEFDYIDSLKILFKQKIV
jgi:hypothetical protein